MKKCSKCGEEKSIDDFHKNGFNSHGKQKYRGYCKICANKRETQRYWDRRSFIESHKKKCAKCREDRVYVLDFHHKNPEEKEFTICRNMINSEKHLLEEIEKCVVLCANCHRAFHHLNKHENLTLDEYLK